jgi:hypothetical protein
MKNLRVQASFSHLKASGNALLALGAVVNGTPGQVIDAFSAALAALKKDLPQADPDFTRVTAERASKAADLMKEFVRLFDAKGFMLAPLKY